LRFGGAPSVATCRDWTHVRKEDLGGFRESTYIS